MKKQLTVFLITILSIAMILSLSSCGGCGKKKTDDPPPFETEEQSTESITSATDKIDESTPQESSSFNTSINSESVFESIEDSDTFPYSSGNFSTTNTPSSYDTPQTTMVPDSTTDYESYPDATTSDNVSPGESTSEHVTYPEITTDDNTSTVESTPEMSVSSESSEEVTEPATPNVYETCDETVYVFGTEEGLNLRSSDDFETDDNVVLTVPNETKLQRIGHDEVHKISIVIYNGEEYYCSSDYITKELPASEILKLFEDVMEEAYVYPDGKWEGEANLYTAPDRTQHASHPITAKTKVFIIGIYYEDAELNGWSKVLVRNNETNKFEEFYMRNSVLTIAAPEN